jgi:nitrogen regulatory protein PII
MVMKRIAVNVRPERVDGMISALRKLGLEATIYDVKGAGKEKEVIRASKGMRTTEQAYTTRKLIATIVDDGRTDEVIRTIKGELAGKPGRAIIMISSVDDLIEV